MAVYTRGPIGWTMMKTAFAMVAGTLALCGYNIADTYFAGRLPGATPLAAMGFTFPVIMLIGCVFRGMTIGVMTISAHALGGNRKEKAAKLVTSGIMLTTVISIFFAVAGILTGPILFRGLGAQGETLRQTLLYMNIWYIGCMTSSLGHLGNDILVAAGANKTASGMMLFGLALNVVLDPLFMFGAFGVPGMGIAGAALATVIAQFLSALLALGILWRRHHLIVIAWIPWRQQRAAWRIMLGYAVPASIGMLLMPIGAVIVTRIVAQYGDVAMAAMAAAGRLEMVAFVFPMALGIALLPMVSQNFGARLYSRIRLCRRFAMTFAFIFLTMMAILYFVFADSLVLYFSSQPDVQQLMAVIMRILPVSFWAIEIHRYSGFFFTGCGKPAAAAWLNALRIVGLLIPFSLLALYFNDLLYVFYARVLADILAGGTGLLLVIRMTRRLPNDGEPPPQLSDDFSLGRMLFRKHRVLATAQADIDSKSSTQ